VIEVCTANGLAWNLLEALRARGLAALLDHDPDRAAESLAHVWAHCQRQGVDEPAEFPVAADLVEALAELGRLEEATAVAGRLRALAEAQQHPWGLATATRCEALIALAEDASTEPLRRLEEAASAYERLGLRFDHARTLLAAGRAARRLRKWKLAADLLERSLAAFEAIGADGWAGETRSELGRIGGRKTATNGALTASERRVAELAADGLTNRQIAAALVISPATVATHLKHAREKLGVRSRAQLTTRL
jgi:DNA-binding CsgD family transcriptional regulator